MKAKAHAQPKPHSVPVLPSQRKIVRTVRSLMTPNPVTTSPENSLQEAVSRMLDEEIRHLPVVDNDGKLVGMLSDRDTRSAIGDLQDFAETSGTDRDDPTVGSVMTKDPVSLEADTTIEELVDALIRTRYGALPVVDANDKLLGIVSYLDVLRALAPSASPD